MATHDSSPQEEQAGISTQPSVGEPASAAATAVQSEPPADSGRIPLPPPSHEMRPMTAEEFTIWTMRLDRILAILAMAVALLLSSYAIRNSDVFTSLASGRDLLQGRYHFGVDPYAYTTDGVYYFNPSWLFDLLVYGIYQLSGGVGLAVFRTLLVTGLAIVLLQIRRPGQGWWATAGCVGLAMLVMSQRFFFQSMLMSFLFLGITLYLLTRDEPLPPEASQSRSERKKAREAVSLGYLWALPVLFAVWANMDAWFLLGPATVLLFWLGEVLQPILSPVTEDGGGGQRGRARTLFLVGIVGTAACLLNPHHIHAFTLPAQLPLGGAYEALRSDGLFSAMFTAGMDKRLWITYADSMNVAGLAFWLLAILNIVSFILNSAGWRWSRFLVCVGFFLLVVVHARAIAFYAVVAGPLTALNLQEYVRLSAGAEPRLTRLWKTWSLGGRTLTALVGVALVVLTWRGWLHGQSNNARQIRRVGWSLEIDPSLESAAKQLCEWRQQGKLQPDDHGFNLTPEIAHYLSYFCPEEKSFIDYRIQLFGKAARSYESARQPLLAPPAGSDPTQLPTDTAWRDLFRAHGINHVILSRQNLQALFQASFGMFAKPEEWDLLYLNGHVAIFGWRGAKHPVPKELRVDLQQLAFGKTAETIPAAPTRSPRVLEWWEEFYEEAKPPDAAADEGQLYQFAFEASVPATVTRNISDILAADKVGWIGTVAAALADSALAGPALHPCIPASRIALDILSRDFFTVNDYRFNHDDGPPAALFLSIRACRRAIAANPDDASAYLRLARAYQHVLNDTQERRWHRNKSMPLILSLRQVQIASALQHALVLDPDNLLAHRMLADLYRPLQVIDLALNEWQEVLRLTKAKGPQLGESEDDFHHNIEELEKQIREMEAEVRERKSSFLVSSANKPLMEQVAVALSKELGGLALDRLQNADAAQIREQSLVFQLELLLKMGRVDEFSRLIEPGMEKDMPPIFYEMLIFRAAAGMGDYRTADDALASATGKVRELVARAEKDPQLLQNLHSLGEIDPRAFSVKVDNANRLAAIGIASQILQASRMSQAQLPLEFHWQLPFRCTQRGTQIVGLVMQAPSQMNAVGDYAAIRGLLSLETGEVAAAKEHFRQALAIDVPFGSRPLAEMYLRQLESADKK